MRSVHRIDPFLRALGDVWKQHPDMRFGQLVMNLSRVDSGFADTWNWEDSEWYRRMEIGPWGNQSDQTPGTKP